MSSVTIIRIWIFPRDLPNSTNIKFHGNQSGKNRTDTGGRADTQTDTTKLVRAFRDYKNVPKNERHVTKDEVKTKVTRERK
jgi:hypothetical protein